MDVAQRIVLFGDGKWAANSLARLHEVGFVMVGVVVRTRPSDDSLSDEAGALNVPIFQPPAVNSTDFLAMVSSLAPDLCLSISYDQILRAPLLATPRLGFVNFHAGKLPRYRGRNIINWAIINGEPEIGLTAHFMDEGIDTGDIILQKTFSITWSDTYGTVLQRIVEAFPEFVLEAVKQVATGSARPVKQELVQGTYFGGRENGDEWLDWSDTSTNLYNKIRAITHPGPGARTLDDDKEVIIWNSAYDTSWPKYIATPGQVVGRDAAGALVKTGDSVLLVTEIQFQNCECEVPAWRIGTRLGMNPMRIYKTLMKRIEELESQLSGDNDRSRGRDK